jgi:type I restriction enzyme M protein
VFGQELNDESYAICKADMLIKGQDVGNIVFGNTLSTTATRTSIRLHALQPALRRGMEEGREGSRKEHEQQGFNGRFGPGLPRVSDGSMLFLLHLISKMRPPPRAAAALASC